MTRVEPPRQAGGLTGRILVLEDEILLALSVEEDLCAAGHQVVGPAARAPQALALLDEAPIDIALIDLSIEGEISYETGAELERRGVPWAMMTGFSESVIDPAFEHVPMLIKPFTDEQLFAVVELLLRRRHRSAPQRGA